MHDPFLGSDWGSHHRVMSDGIEKLIASAFSRLRSRWEGPTDAGSAGAPFDCDGRAIRCCE